MRLAQDRITQDCDFANILNADIRVEGYVANPDYLSDPVLSDPELSDPDLSDPDLSVLNVTWINSYNPS